MAPSKLAIATSALERLVKEEKSYHAEMTQQQTRIGKLETSVANGEAEEEGEAGNREYELKQERRALEETKAVIPGLKGRILVAREKLEDMLENTQSTDKADEIMRARQVLTDSKALA